MAPPGTIYRRAFSNGAIGGCYTQMWCGLDQRFPEALPGIAQALQLETQFSYPCERLWTRSQPVDVL